MKGYLQVYTGNGKGKTAAALGLSLRAAGAGLKVYLAQFRVQGSCSGIKALERLSDNIDIQQFGLKKENKGQSTQAGIGAARRGIEKIKQQLSSGEYDVVILGNGNLAASMGLISVPDLLDVIHRKPEHVELVITGRGAAPEVIERADLVTEMEAVKHYHDKGVQARGDIEK